MVPSKAWASLTHQPEGGCVGLAEVEILRLVSVIATILSFPTPVSSVAIPRAILMPVTVSIHKDIRISGDTPMAIVNLVIIASAVWSFCTRLAS